MKRDLELIRAILLEVEELPIGQFLSSIEIEGHSDEVIAEHVRLLEEVNFIEAQLAHGRSNFGALQVKAYAITRLLNDGHDFIANAKNPTIWKKTTNFIQERGGDVSLAVTKAVMAKEALQLFGLN